MAATLAMTMQLPRGSLYRVVSFCQFAQQTFGEPYPCIAVRPGPEGFAVLRAPGAEFHYIVAPTARVIGLESPPARAALAAASWRSALALRPVLVEQAGIAFGDVVLSVNPRRSRGQDQLHIHVGCGEPELLRIIRSDALSIGRHWARLDRPIGGTVFWARRVRSVLAQQEDPFVSLRKLPRAQIDPDNVVFETFSLTRSGNGDLVHLATQTAGTSAEDALDLECRRQ